MGGKSRCWWKDREEGMESKFYEFVVRSIRGVNPD